MSVYAGYTTHFKFGLIDFNVITWHDEENANWRTLDTILNQLLGIDGVKGQWENGTQYNAGEYAIDNDVGTMYKCLVTHTSALAGTFAADRAANPTYWTTVSAFIATVQATETQAGVAEIAEVFVEARDSTDHSRIITPKGLSHALTYSLIPGGYLTANSPDYTYLGDASTLSTIYYIAVGHGLIAVPDPVDFNMRVFAIPRRGSATALKLTLNATNHPIDNYFDVFVFNDNGTLRLGTQIWAGSRSSTGGGFAYQGITQSLDNDIWYCTGTTLYNGATQYTLAEPETAVYVGTFYTTAAGQTTYSQRRRLIWNAHNRRRVPVFREETVNTWTYSTTSYRRANANASNQIDALVGLNHRSEYDIMVMGRASNSTSTPRQVRVGLSYTVGDMVNQNTTSINSGNAQEGGVIGVKAHCTDTIHGLPSVRATGTLPDMGTVTFQWLEYGGGTDTQTWYGQDSESSSSRHAAGIIGWIEM